MISKRIKTSHLLHAAEKINIEGTPKHRSSTKYDVIVNYKRYPPKYLIAIASKLALGKMIKAETYNGGVESNSFLRSRGFKITNKRGEIIDYP